MMRLNELLEAADVGFKEFLISAGFRRAAPGSWDRRRNEELNVIQIQKHSAEQSFSVNLGVHYSFIPKVGAQAPLHRSQIGLLDCELRFRLTDRESLTDQWWPIASSSVEPVVDLVRLRALPLFDRYEIDGPISKINASSIEIDNSILKCIPRVRAYLLLARIHEHFGNRDKCIEMAIAGIEVAGIAVGPKKALKDILIRCEQKTG